MMTQSTQNQLRQGNTLLEVSDLRISFGKTDVVHGINFAVQSGEILGIVGESGSGKTVSCRALTSLLPDSARSAGRMQFDGQTYDLADGSDCARLRGNQISMIFQDPMSALDPLMKIRRQLSLRGVSGIAAETLLHQVGFPEPAVILDRYPHQLSGGQCQRIVIACAMITKPKLLIADEPTTALDVTIQAGILNLLRKTVRETGMSMVFITHDLSVVSQLCDRVMVMQHGKSVEVGHTAQLLRHPRATYTRSLIAAIPRPESKGQRLPSLEDIRAGTEPALMPVPPVINRNKEPVLSFRNICVDYQRADGSAFRAVNDISLDIHHNEIVGIVGESGSGKSTLSKTAVGLVKPTSGGILIDGKPIDWDKAARADRRQIQYIFQDPRGALDPSRRVLSQIREPLDVHAIGKKSERNALAAQELSRAGLDLSLHMRKPGHLSGGQRQRVTIARALALSPKILICDESVSALDVSVQAKILNTLLEIRAQRNIAILFISHDLSVIQHLCDRVVVMQSGQVVETGLVDDVWQMPQQNYTRELLTALPQLPVAAMPHEVCPA